MFIQTHICAMNGDNSFRWCCDTYITTQNFEIFTLKQKIYGILNFGVIV